MQAHAHCSLHCAPAPFRKRDRTLQGVSRTQCAAQRDSRQQEDSRLALVRVLLDASTAQLSASASSAFDWLTSAVTAVTQLTQPLPPGFPPGPDGDVAIELGTDPLALLTRVTARYGGAVGVKLAGARAVVVSDTQLARGVLIDDAAHYTKRGTAFFPGSVLTGEGLLVSDGEVWRRQRRLSNPSFRAAAVASYATSMGMAAMSMTQPGGAWAQLSSYSSSTTIVRDVYPDFNDLTLQIVATTLFGVDVRGPDAAEINAAIADAFAFFATRASQPPLLPEWVPTLDNVRLNAAVTRLDAAVYRLIAQRRRSRRDGSVESMPTADLLDRLLASVDEDTGLGMTDKQLRDELMTLLVAGQETSAILLTWACSLLAQHPEAQSAVAAEAEAVLGETRAPDAADYMKLHHAAAVVLETMRLMPPAYLVGRCADVDVQLGEHRLPKGTTLLVSPYIMHRSLAAWGADATEFRPQRWFTRTDADGAATVNVNEALKGMGKNDAYIPFGAGPRNCIGTGFALMEAVLVLAALSRRARFRVPPGQAPPQPAALLTLRPAAARLELSKRAQVVQTHQ